MRRSTELAEHWSLVLTGGAAPQALLGRRVPASVPGVIHTDLLAAGLVTDPYLDENEEDLGWVGRTTSRYATAVELAPPAPGERIELVFEGLDTVCDVRLDDRLLGSPRNMHRTHRYDVTDLVRAGPQEVAVDFAAQLDATEEASEALGPRVHVNRHPYNAVRKMACNYGWDWGPDLVTAGIWRPVRVERWQTARLDAVRILVSLADGVGRVEVHADIVRASDLCGSPEAEHPALDLLVTCAGASVTVPIDGDHAVALLEIHDPAVWWPRGYGQQPLHELRIALAARVRASAPDDPSTGAGELDRLVRRVGFRTVTLDTTPDEWGTPFTIQVNGLPVLVKGANWIPDDCFPSRVDRSRYARRISDAVDAGMNLLRVWGGGLLESDDFYDICDENGILVWQDFLFACAAYAEESPLADEVVAEVTEAVTRLGSHPSLAVWNGNNENLWGHEDWGWAEQLGTRTWGRGYYLEVLPELVSRLDPTRPYSPGSPWSFDESRHPNDPSHGTVHIWDVWNEADYTAYRSWVPRFVTEFGYQGPPTWTTLTGAIHDEPLTPTSPGVSWHQKAEDGNGKLARGIAPHLEPPDDMTDWHWAMSVQQARAVAFGIEHFRSWQPVCMGAVVWQLNDCWPVTSWAAVDGAGRRKPLWYALRHAFADRLLTIQPRDTGLVVAICNDTDEEWEARVQLRRLTFAGAERAMSTIVATVPARSVVTRPVAAALVADSVVAEEVLVAETGSERALWFFGEDRSLDLTEGWRTTAAERTSDGYAVYVTAETLQRDVSLLVDKVDRDATVDDMVVTLLPGESHTFLVTSGRTVDPARYLDRAVLRTTNQLVHPSPARPRTQEPT